MPRFLRPWKQPDISDALKERRTIGSSGSHKKYTDISGTIKGAGILTFFTPQKTAEGSRQNLTKPNISGGVELVKTWTFTPKYP